MADVKARRDAQQVSGAPFKVLPREQWTSQRPTYKDAEPAIIDAALLRSQRRPSGNWYAFAASDSIRKGPLGTSVGGLEIVAWRDTDSTLHVGPYMSAPRREPGRAPWTAAR